MRVLVLVLLLVSVRNGTCQESQKPQLRRMKYNHPGLIVDLGVGLWGWPLPLDYDRDGDLDLVVSF